MKRSTQPVCYRYVIYNRVFRGGPRRESTRALKIIDNNLKQTLNKSSSCASTYALFVQRNKTRKILNIDELVNVTRQTRYFKRVEQANFDAMSFEEQWSLARCASLLVGVQGAGMSWFVFQPKSTSFIEIAFDGWHYLFNSFRGIFRRDMKSSKMWCKRVTSTHTWAHYARTWFNYTGPINSEWKKNLTMTAFQIKSKLRYAFTPLKDSDVTCNPGIFKQTLVRLTKQLKI